MKTATFQDLVACLTADKPPRVWSLLVTVFGELAQDAGAQIDGATLSQLTALMGIKPEAMRVALHRLRKDGWIDSARNGRTRSHFLTDWGRAQSAQASPRIYGLAPVTAPSWLVVCDPSDTAGTSDAQTAWITSNLALTTHPDMFKGAFKTQITADTPLPDWMRDKVCKPATSQQAQTFATQLRCLEDAAQNADTLNTLEVSALRVLIVHGWRRIVLRTPALPDDVFPATWPSRACRESVAALLAKYPKP